VVCDKSYNEVLSHVDIGLKNTYYFCVIKYDLLFIDINDVYIEVFSANTNMNWKLLLIE